MFLFFESFFWFCPCGFLQRVSKYCCYFLFGFLVFQLFQLYWYMKGWSRRSGHGRGADYICIYIYIYLFIYVCKYIYISIYIYIYLSLSVSRPLMYTYIYIHTETVGTT
jgi:hypothetical protein